MMAEPFRTSYFIHSYGVFLWSHKDFPFRQMFEMMIRYTYFFMGLLCLYVCMAEKAWGQKRDSARWNKTIGLNEIVVRGSNVARINNSAYNAVAVDAARLRNTNLDVAHLLDRVSGIKIREDGGVGSTTSINLNGFTGKHVKVFIDGVPMDGAASSFGINNIPLSMTQRVEVYKGVIPVSFGADALGGAINIITDRRYGSYVDASYSFGSFNTHRSAVALGHTSHNGWVLKANLYQNYSDNDYRVKVQNTDLQTMQISNDEEWFRRFHNRYHNEGIVLQTGITGKKWADRMMIGVTYSNEYAQIQHANLMKVVFGGKLRKTQGLTPTLMYEKRNLLARNLDFLLSLRYDMAKTNNIDTVSRTYNWAGQYIVNDYQGEGVATLAQFRSNTFALVSTLRYRLGTRHSFILSNTFSDYRRHTTNDAANAVQSTPATFMRRVNTKNVWGLSYMLVPSDRWNVTGFMKHYMTHVRGPVNVSGRDYEEQTRSMQAFGYGFAASYNLTNSIQAKLSYEKTYRLPTDRELFGDGDYEQGETRLRPEKSHNINLNLNFQHTFNDIHNIGIDGGFFHRHINDYIIRTISRTGTAVSTNHGKMLGQGMDISVHYDYKNVLNINANYTWQSIRDKKRLTTNGASSITFNDRVPNMPYSFGNIDADYTFKDVMGKGNHLTIGYYTRYVHRFYRSWRSAGARLFIPEQWSHDLSLCYALVNGRYNIALEANNFTDRLLYDNYSLQKPGRSFSIKFRYVFYKNDKPSH